MTVYTDKAGQQFELPKMTVKVREDFEKALTNGVSDREICVSMLGLLKGILPDDYIEERCGGKSVESVDIIEVSILAEEVWDAYTRPLAEAQMERHKRDFAEIEPMIDSAKLVAQLAQSGNQNRTKFKHVR